MNEKINEEIIAKEIDNKIYDENVGKNVKDIEKEYKSIDEKREEKINASIVNEVNRWKRKPTKKELEIVRLARKYERQLLSTIGKRNLVRVGEILSDYNKEEAIKTFKNFLLFFHFLAYGDGNYNTHALEWSKKIKVLINKYKK